MADDEFEDQIDVLRTWFMHFSGFEKGNPGRKVTLSVMEDGRTPYEARDKGFVTARTKGPQYEWYLERMNRV